MVLLGPKTRRRSDYKRTLPRNRIVRELKFVIENTKKKCCSLHDRYSRIFPPIKRNNFFSLLSSNRNKKKKNLGNLQIYNIVQYHIITTSLTHFILVLNVVYTINVKCTFKSNLSYFTCASPLPYQPPIIQ